MAFSLLLHGILAANKLIGPNYIDWLRNLRIILIQEKLSYILDTPNLDEIGKNASKEDRAIYKMWKDDNLIVKYIILVSMSNELLRQHENMDPQSILLNLCMMSKVELLE